MRQFVFCRLHELLLPLLFDAEARALHTVDILHVDDAVLEFCRLLVICESRRVVSPAFREFVVQPVYIREVFVALDVLCYLLRLGEIIFRHFIVVFRIVYANESDEGVECVPVVYRCRHDVVRLLVFCEGFVVHLLFLVHPSEEGVAEGYAELVSGVRVVPHRAFVVDLCAVHPAFLLENRTDVCAVYRQSDVASESLLPSESEAQDAVGALVVAEGEIDVSQTVERDDDVLPCDIRRVGVVSRHDESPLVVFVRHRQNAHASVVRADVVQRLHPFDAVVQPLCQFQRGVVFLQRLVIEAAVAFRVAPQP